MYYKIITLYVILNLIFNLSDNLFTKALVSQLRKQKILKVFQTSNNWYFVKQCMKIKQQWSLIQFTKDFIRDPCCLNETRIW